MKRENKALWNLGNNNDDIRVLTNNNPDIYAFKREKEDDKIFAIFNLTDQNKTIVPVGESFIGSYTDVFTKDTLTLSQGSEIILEPWGYYIYEGFDELTNVNEDENIRHNYSLSQNYPNPFNPTTTIKYTIAAKDKSRKTKDKTESREVKLTVYDIIGREIATLVNQKQRPGNYKIAFNGSNYPSGVYFYKIIIGDYSDVKKMMLMK
ncbi:MAG: T9SS type A sorting domain-containing protein [Melioribacteraceae bacterium]|nr:T9SS type A sorting domain-containing protein [Melioribacteraceae bacterium]